VKVKVEFVVDIDADTWSNEFGIDGVMAIRADVKAYTERLAHDALNHQGLLTEGY
jgi:hypothetical protein